MTEFLTDGRVFQLPDGRRIPCSMGRTGLIDAADKREGDGATPVGRWKLVQVYYRADRVSGISCNLPMVPISARDGWCDDPADPAYNQAVDLPFPASHEALWREDGLYDILVVVDHNTAPAVPGLGSAIFLHCRHPEGKPTEGCIAIDTAELRGLLAGLAGMTESAFLDIRRGL